MVLMSMVSIFSVVGTNSTMRKIVPCFGGTSPTLVLPRSAVQEKSGGLLSVTHISLAGFGERKLVSCTWPSSITTALPEASILVTTRRTSGSCCAATEPARIKATPGTTHDRLLLTGLSQKRIALGRLRAGPGPVEHRHAGGDDACHVRNVGREDQCGVGLGEVAAGGLTFAPQARPAWSSTATIERLITSRLCSDWSSSILPTSERRVVCASCTIAVT